MSDMDIVSLEAVISSQEEVITQLEQELHQLQSAQNTETEKEAEKLRLANDKLRYRIHILEAATAEELSQAKA